MDSKEREYDHVQGDKNSPIELVEYADYQCPYCGKAYYVLKKVKEELGNDLKFIFRNFPLTQMHRNALHAAIAAEAAGLQNKFWEMHDLLFENQDALQDYDLLNYAKELKLDIDKFEQDFNNKLIMQKINKDYESGIANGVSGTPAFFINGEQFNGNWMSPEFIEYLHASVR